MKIISKKSDLFKFVNNEKKLGFVPTMGALHKGHISLIKKSIFQCNKTIVSIFINKPQFNRKNDFKSYPRILKKDISQLKKLKVDYLYIPTSKQIYPFGPNNKIKISSFANKLCGKFRPGYFNAVTDVVERFIKLIKPKKIFFGEKDMQQLKIIQNFLQKKYKNIEVIPCKTIREKNGVASSSRNFLLSQKQMKIASKVYKILFYKKKKLIKQKVMIKKIEKKILSLGVKKIDYIEILNINRLIKPFSKKNNYRIFIAYYLGNTRLIDNI